MNTPIHQINYDNNRGIKIYIKRDDFLPFSLGGNKVRIAEQFFNDMNEKGCNAMIIYGNSRSNLCRVLANKCYKENIPCIMVCSSEDHEDQNLETNNSRLMNWLGAKVVHCTKSNIAETVEKSMEDAKSEGLKPYYIFGDKFGKGNESTPVQAYVEGYKEIAEWEKANNTGFSHIFHASGTGSTQSGLVAGKLILNGNEHIVGISISSREYDRAMDIMETGIKEYFQKNNIDKADRIRENLTLEMSYRAGGYGLFNDEILEVIRQQFCENGLPLDSTYTGKAFWGMTKYIEANDLHDCNILFLHTGGTPLFYDGLCGGEK